MEQNFDELMRRYKEELLRYDRMQRAAAQATNRESADSPREPQTAEPPVQHRQDEPIHSMDEPPMPEPPMPNTQNSMGTLSELQPQGNPEENNLFQSNNPQNLAAVNPAYALQDTDEGYMIVRLSAAQESIPVANADIIITREVGDNVYLMWHAVSDANGKSNRIALPAPAREMSEQPQDGVPYAVYNIRVSAPGYFTVTNYDAQVFGGETSIVAINMLPKAETQMGGLEELTFTTPPSELLNS